MTERLWLKGGSYRVTTRRFIHTNCQTVCWTNFTQCQDVVISEIKLISGGSKLWTTNVQWSVALLVVHTISTNSNNVMDLVGLSHTIENKKIPCETPINSRHRLKSLSFMEKNDRKCKFNLRYSFTRLLTKHCVQIFH